MSELWRPAVEWELKSMIAQLQANKRPVEILGHGSLRGVGRPLVQDIAITTASMRGVTLYQPTELVMAAKAGTPLLEIEAELAAHGQMLPFEPMDLGPASGGPASSQTIGGVFATNLSGPRRISAGGARDHLLGISAVNGRAEAFKSGGRVMKNVTGYDVARGLTGSWGTLAVLTEVTFKVVPMPEAILTLVYPGLPDDLAVELMTAAMATPYDISSAAHLPKATAARLTHPRLKDIGEALTAVRLENFATFLAGRSGKLKEALKVYGTPLEFGAEETYALWSDIRHLNVMPFSTDTSLWRISTAPTKAPEIVAAIERFMPAHALYDWSGGLVWLEVPAAADAGSADVRRAVAVRGGHATLIRAAPGVRQSVEIFEPMRPEVDRLTKDLKSSFDPDRLLNPGRMYAHI
ncbi:MAG: FAD-binding protein [Hyphomicrobium sp.]